MAETGMQANRQRTEENRRAFSCVHYYRKRITVYLLFTFFFSFHNSIIGYVSTGPISSSLGGGLPIGSAHSIQSISGRSL